ncbi:hypothetical protein ETB97_012322 [Aspergillus alliaceus]|uniref:MFS transporter n=1 Tax=Petromyces alliaceus TaxID=209559 RepID=A0A8H6A387_PETAA|nr:hypothetical protein ETB97_012322 [Aspergillus burnettii]
MASGVDRDAIPGTFTLLDLEHTLASRHLDRGNSDIVLVPQPSDDPDDPLNWSPRRKTLSTICVSVLGPTFLAAPRITVWQTTRIYRVFNRNDGNIDMGNNGQWIGRSILSGFFTSPVEALPEITVTDVYFTHERGTYMGLYAFFLAGSNYFAPVICGFIAEYQGWEWVFYWPAVFCAAAAAFLFLFMEETNYTRENVSPITSISPTEPSISASEKGEQEKATPIDTAQHTNSELGDVYNKKTYIKKLSLLGPRQPKNHMLRRLWHGLYYLSWPVVFYAGFSYGSYLIWFNVLNATASIILGSAPYNFSTAMVGLSYLACCLGVILGALFTGRFSDWLTIHLARRNNGIMEAEHRLWPFLICLVIVPGSLILWGVGAAHEIHWFGLLVAMCVLAMANTCGITLSVNYLIDSYRELSGDAMTSIILVRNTMSFAIGYGITPWIDNLGYQNCFISAAFIGMACSAAFLFMIKYGKALRKRNQEKYWNQVIENRENGMAH